ncbi:MAG: hypothetical protein KBD37_03520 [Burkholderiales bacterium]|nr:hypothetical protein [Burkholderiales bacterium]
MERYEHNKKLRWILAIKQVFIVKEEKPCHVTREGHIIPNGKVMQAGHMQLYGVKTLVFGYNSIIIVILLGYFMEITKYEILFSKERLNSFNNLRII